MGTLTLHNGYSMRRWLNTPRSNMNLAFDEVNRFMQNNTYYIEWEPDDDEKEEGVVVGNKNEVLETYKSLEIALAKAWPQRYSPSRDEMYSLDVVNDEVVYRVC